MQAADLMRGSHPKALDCPHFPTRLQAVIWRNWELVPVARLAAVLEAKPDDIVALAAHMGLRVPPVVRPEWLTRGYVTLIRANWQLLPYQQLLTLLGWTADHLDFTLREDDFLWQKLGNLKPDCPKVVYAPLTDEQRRATEALRALLDQHFPTRRQPDAQSPFAFLDSLAHGAKPPAGRHWSAAEPLRLIYSYSAVYGDPLAAPELDPFPDGLLARLADRGVNGVWLQGLLYKLHPWAAAPEHSAGWEDRLRTLAALAKRADRYGIGVYLYLNEPRGMPLAFYDQHPDLKGVAQPGIGVAALCTSRPAVREYLHDATRFVFDRVPELAGAFTITMSENLTHCWSHGQGAQCPLCKDRAPAEVVAEVNGIIADGAHAAKPEARVIAWAWAWPADWDEAVVEKLPPNVELMCTSEEALPTNVGGVAGSVLDYSISQPGPGPKATRLWAKARARGLRTNAKVQLNITWECSAVPWLPAFDLVGEHLTKLSAAGVQGHMVSWTLGGWPSPVLGLLSQAPDRLLTGVYGAHAPVVTEACHRFSTAFREFPFHIGTAYNAPQNCGPRNLLFAEPSGYPATMVGIPYDDLGAWRSIYAEDVFEQQFRKLSDGWKTGLDLLAGIAGKPDAALTDLRSTATAAWCMFRSTYLQVAFVRRRAKPEAKAELLAILDEEIAVAKTLCELARADSRLGFEATNHYAYTTNDLREKVLNCA
ncbi:MAG: hypothetical protein HZB16_24195, partial [Armatimonadetes bacterium]|nr:hypothetical protein [Armatimonadota bacterium]